MVTDLSEIRRLAESKEAENLHFRRYLHAHHRPIEPFQVLATEVQHHVDCTKCANCCRYTVVNVTHEDMDAIATHLQCTVDEVLHRYVRPDPDDSALHVLVNEHDACTFLDGNLCSIYEARPAACRNFPHVAPHTNSLGGRVSSIWAHTDLCPIIFNAVEAYKHLVGYHYHTRH